jgi:hypothetical protein
MKFLLGIVLGLGVFVKLTTSQATVDCGLQGTEEERAQDCLQKLGAKAYQCAADFIYPWEVVNCDHQEFYHKDRISFRKKQIVTQTLDTVTYRTVGEELHFDVPIWEESHLESTPPDLACYVRKKDYLKKVFCEHVSFYEKDGLKVSFWKMIHQDGLKKIWKNEKSGYQYAAPYRKVNSSWFMPGALRAQRICEGNQDSEVTLGTHFNTSYQLPSCLKLKQDLEMGLIYLISFADIYSRRLWCESDNPNSPMAILLDTMSVVSGLDPFDKMGAMCSGFSPTSPK